jgi:dihydrofolate reductase
MPWHLPEDFAHFKKLTSGHPIIMGERTWLSLPQGALPNRTNIVLSHDLDTDITPGAHVVTSVAEALQLARESTGGESVWVIGGSSVYEQMIPLADSLVVTEIDLVVSADTYAPEIPSSFQLDPSDETWLTSKNGTAYRFRNYTHKPV